MVTPFKAYAKYTAGVVRFIRRPQYNAYAYRSTTCMAAVVQPTKGQNSRSKMV